MDSERAVLWLRRSISHSADGWIEGDLKTHQQRRVALDPETVSVLAEHRDRCRARAAALGLSLDKDAFVFSPQPDGSRFLAPSSLTQRYDRLAKRLDVETTFHKLRHYSATELVASGVDIRTVAGRLGHGGGGTATLKAYAAWVSEADQRAAKHIGGRMPERPMWLNPVERAKADPQNPYERIAGELRRDILAGMLVDGERVPSTKQIAAEYNVSVATVHRSMELLKEWGLITSCRGKRATVVRPPESEDKSDVGTSGVVNAPTDAHAGNGRELLDLEVWWRGTIVKKLTAEADPKDANGLRQLLVDAIRRHGRDESQIAEYEMEIRYFGVRDLLTTFVASAR